jgi:hypothetical protein
VGGPDQVGAPFQAGEGLTHFGPLFCAHARFTFGMMFPFLLKKAFLGAIVPAP